MKASKDERLGISPLSVVDSIRHHPVEELGAVAVVMVQ